MSALRWQGRYSIFPLSHVEDFFFSLSLMFILFSPVTGAQLFFCVCFRFPVGVVEGHSPR